MKAGAALGRPAGGRDEDCWDGYLHRQEDDGAACSRSRQAPAGSYPREREWRFPGWAGSGPWSGHWGLTSVAGRGAGTWMPAAAAQPLTAFVPILSCSPAPHFLRSILLSFLYTEDGGFSAHWSGLERPYSWPQFQTGDNHRTADWTGSSHFNKNIPSAPANASFDLECQTMKISNFSWGMKRFRKWTTSTGWRFQEGLGLLSPIPKLHWLFDAQGGAALPQLETSLPPPHRPCDWDETEWLLDR